MIEIAFLGSGSSGNAAVIRTDRCAVLLDCGLSPRETRRRLARIGGDAARIEAVLLTHEHGDHAHYAKSWLLRQERPVYATEGTARAARLPGPLFADVRTAIPGRDLVFGKGSLHVRVTRTPHDGTESVCYVFSDGDGRRIGVVTDLGRVSEAVIEALAGCEVVGLEANHDVDLLRDGPYPAWLKRRILGDFGHISNEVAAAALPRLVGPRTRRVVALHVSQHNNTPALARASFEDALARLGSNVPVDVAPAGEPLGWIAA